MSLKEKFKLVKENILSAIRNILIVVLCLGMVGAGMLKLVGLPAVTELFIKWGLGDTLRIVIGILEVTIGVGILIPKTRIMALGVLLLEMMGAAAVHIYNGEFFDLRGPFGVSFAAVTLLWLNSYLTQKSSISN